MDAFERIADELYAQGFCVCAGFLAPANVSALRAEAQMTQADFRAAGIGRDSALQRDAAVRSDQIRWLDPQAPAQRAFLAAMENLRQVLNGQLQLGLFDYEAHFAHYAAGAFYRRHLDTFAGGDVRKPRRVLSTVVYLNAEWRSDDGGELVLYDVNERELTRVPPLGGTAVIFLSEEFPHEVLPANRERYSIAGWMRRRGG